MQRVKFEYGAGDPEIQGLVSVADAVVGVDGAMCVEVEVLMLGAGHMEP